MDEDLPIPLPRPPPHGPPSVAQVTTYQTGRTQYPLASHPMQTAMGPVMWAGRGLGKWDPLPGYGVGPAAPYLAPEREAAFIRTQPMHNGLGYQMVLMRANGVPIGGTPQTTPQYVTAGPIQAGYMSFVQPIMRAEQMPMGGGRPILANPSLGGNSGPWAWNVRQTLRGAGVYGGPYAWPYIDPPAGYKVIGTNEGGWPIFSELPQAPARYPTDIEEPIQRADANPGLPLAGARLALAAVGAGLVAGGTTAALSAGSSGEGRPGASSRPTRRNPFYNPSGRGGQVQMPMLANSRNPHRNPLVWPFALGAAALGGIAYGLYRCAPGERHNETDAMPGLVIRRSLSMDGCFKELPWSAVKVSTPVFPGSVPIRETASFGTKLSAMEWLYRKPAEPQPEESSGDQQTNPAPGYGMARQFRPDGSNCEPFLEREEREAAWSLGNAFWSVHHRPPTQIELHALANEAYSHVYPEGSFPSEAANACAERWSVLQALILVVINARIEKSREMAAPRWWSAGGPTDRSVNPIPGSVGYNGYSHTGAGYAGPLSGGPGVYLNNPPPHPRGVALPPAAQRRWSGFRSPRRFDGRIAADNPCGSNPSCGCAGGCAGEAR